MTLYLANWASVDLAEAINDDHQTILDIAEPAGLVLYNVDDDTIAKVLARAYQEEVVDMHELLAEEAPKGAWEMGPVQPMHERYYRRWLWVREGQTDAGLCVIIREATTL